MSLNRWWRATQRRCARCPGPSRVHGYRPHNSRGLPRLLELLRREGVVPAQAQIVPPPSGGAEQCIQAFDRRLESVAGLAASTRKNLLGFARGLLVATFGKSSPDFTQLRAEHVPRSSRPVRLSGRLSAERTPATRSWLSFASSLRRVWFQIICSMPFRGCASGRMPHCCGFCLQKI